MNRMGDLVGAPVVAARPPARRRGWVQTVRGRLAVAVAAGYLGLSAVVLTSFDVVAASAGLTFLIVNGCISLAFLTLFRARAAWPLQLLMYGLYWVMYVAKGVVQYAVGLNTLYSWVTIRTTVSLEDYFDALQVATVGHATLAVVLVGSVLASDAKLPERRSPSRATGSLTKAVHVFAVLWIPTSSVIMYLFGVAIMGTKSVSLPYGMAGMLFYSRTLLLPMLLLYCIQNALLGGDSRAFRRSIVLLAALALSEVVVRASKAPLFMLLLQLVFLWLSLKAGGRKLQLEVNKRLVVGVAVAATALVPVVDVYRGMAVEGAVSSSLVSDVASYVESSGKGLALFAGERVFDRLQGFMQLSGVVAGGAQRVELDQLWMAGGIAEYYTREYLGLSMEGHLSSPSILGASILVGGAGWWLVFGGYAIAMVGVWRAGLLFPRMALPVACFVGCEVLNTFIGGTMDDSAWRLGLLFAGAAISEALGSAYERDRQGRRSRVAPTCTPPQLPT